MLSLTKNMVSSLNVRVQIVNCILLKQNLEWESVRNILLQKRNCNKNIQLSKLFSPVPVEKDTENSDVGLELVGNLDKPKLVKIISTFYRDEKMKSLAAENNIDSYILRCGFASFRNYCLTANLPADLHIVLSDITNNAANHLDIFPFFLRHIKQMFPHLDCIDDLKKIGDFRSPANWYPEARKFKRKIIFHCGPTNSGKTYHALERFFTSKSGVYCAPLKLLATEVFNKSNERGTPCDLVTGDEIINVNPNEEPASHISCTIEMCCIDHLFDVAIIDEIQMIRDVQRGGAWTRALLGLQAKEIHLCGEKSAINIVDYILCTTHEELEVVNYERLTKLETCEPLKNFESVENGDCIVCFSKQDIFHVTKTLEDLGKEVAVIYGSLPPGTKIAQCRKFNDANNSCNILVATDAVGMGLNLSIRRIIFYSLLKPVLTNQGRVEMSMISVSQALQIAGRAGRFRTKYETGYVTTYNPKDFPLLQEILKKQPEAISKAGLHPTIEQIELFSFYLPKSSLTKLLDIFVNLLTLDDSLYFLCDMKDLQRLAEMISHLPLSIRNQYIFSSSPVAKKSQLNNALFVKFARLFSENKIISANWLSQNISWPSKMPTTIEDLYKAEELYEVLELYLWFSQRFPDYFVDSERIRGMKQELDSFIRRALLNIRTLQKESDSGLTELQSGVRSRTLRSYRSRAISSPSFCESKVAQILDSDEKSAFK